MLFFSNQQKPGKGVKKNVIEKRNAKMFFRQYTQLFSKMIGLNLIFIIVCIPLVTIGPGITAITHVLTQYVRKRPVFLLSDFWDAFKRNFHISFILQWPFWFCCVGMLIGIQFYWKLATLHLWAYIPLLCCFSVFFFILLVYGYLCIMLPLLQMKFKEIIKNAVFLSLLGIKINLLVAVIVLVLTTVMIKLFPFTLLLILLLFFSSMGFMVVFAYYTQIEHYIIKPYYEKTGENHPDCWMQDEEDSVFKDTDS